MTLLNYSTRRFRWLWSKCLLIVMERISEWEDEGGGIVFVEHLLGGMVTIGLDGEKRRRG
jgi:hypothetical protein